MKDLFTSRKFWVSFIALLVIVLSQLVPGFDLDQEQTAAMAVIVVSYILGVTYDPGPGGWKGVILSRKFWAAAIGLLLIVLNAFHIVLPFDLTTDQLVSMVIVICGYIAGVAIEQPKKEPPASPPLTVDEPDWREG